MDYTIVIPTHNRVDVIQKKTLPLLKRLRIPPSKITLVVSGAEQKKLYEAVPKELYGHLLSVGGHGIGEAKNAITRHYPAGKKLVYVEDDLNNLMKLSGDGNKLVPLTDLEAVIKEGFSLASSHKTILWGIYAVPNAFFMKKETTFDLKFIIGTCYGLINDKKIHLHTNVKEDYELSLEVFKRFGAIVRFNNIVARRKAYPDFGSGGLDDLAERKRRTEVSVDYLLKTYPTLIHESKKTKLGLREIQMNRGAGLAGVSETVKGSGKPPEVDISEEDRNDASIKTLPIRNRAKYNATKQHLLEVLQSQITVSKIPKPDERSSTNRGNIIGTIGRTMTFGFGDNRHGWNFYATNKKHPEVFKALIEFGNQIVPKGWEYQGITLNHGVKAKKHTDSKNVGASVIIGIGDFTGGEIRVWNKDNANPQDKNLHDKPVMFNGGLLPHETQPFKGDRYTIIYYKQKRRPRTGEVGVGSGKGAEPLTPPNPETMGAIYA